jgi:hypothetical protein
MDNYFLLKINKLIETNLININELINNIISNDIYYKEEFIEPFNIILAASDIYYYENYHSDIIAYILENKYLQKRKLIIIIYHLNFLKKMKKCLNIFTSYLIY